MLDILNRYAHGFVLVPVVLACRRGGVLSTLETAPLSAGELAHRLGANRGHLEVALRLFESLGWVDRDTQGRMAVTAALQEERSIPDELWRLVEADFDGYLSTGSGGLIEPWLDRVRGRWHSANPRMADFMDGMLIVPVLTGLAKRGLLRKLAGDFEGIPSGARAAVISLLKILGWLEDSPTGFRLSPPGTFMFERALNLGLAESYRPLLRSMDDLLFGDAERCFTADVDGNETHVDRSMNVISSGAQHDRYFAEVDEILISIFSREPLSAQPCYVADMGCGDGTFLRRVYSTVRDKTPRGRVLSEHPLTLIGIDLNHAALEETSRTLAEIAHRVIPGDIGNPRQVVEDLRRAGIDPGQVLHIRSFLDHDRPYVEPTDRASLANRASGRYLGAYADRKGDAIPAAAVVQSLVEHLQRWAQIVNAHGLILLEVHCQDPRVVRTHVDQSESLYFDALQGFSHQLLVEADAYLMAAGEAGLFPRAEYFRKFPQHLPYSRITLNLFEQQPYRVRIATSADIPALLRLEEACWPESMRMPAVELTRRMVCYSHGQWLLEIEGQVVGVIYSQRIADIDRLRNAKFPLLASLHEEDGSVIQLLALNVLPEMQHLGLGYQLLDLILMRSALQGGVSAVAGITRCKEFHGKSLDELTAYVRQTDPAGRPLDPILNFHHSHGAELLGLVEDFRPEDADNLGAGVLLRYDLTAPGTTSRSGVETGGGTRGSSDGADVSARLETSLRRLLGRKRESAFSWTQPLRDMGLDSLDMLGLRTLIQQTFEQPLSPTFFFSHPTLEDMRKFFDRSGAGAQPTRSPANEPVVMDTDTIAPLTSPAGTIRDTPAIAIVGMACRFPGAANLEEYWQLLERGVDAVTAVPAQRWDANQFLGSDRDVPGTIVSDQGGFLANVEEFDAAFFNISPREARLMDPQQRILLETHWESLEHAGIDPTRLRDTACGIFVGLSSHDYELLQVETGAKEDLEAHYATGNSAAIAAGRLAYFLGTRGPALTLDTACSSSLVAVHQAIRSLRSGECNLALASGANLMLSPRLSMAYSRAGMLSPRGRCRTFDAGADGYVRAEGCGVVVLKRLEDARRDGDVILAVLRGSAVNQDGASNGLTAPNLTAQEQLLHAGLRDANLKPGEIDYIEAHGTGTSLGDPVEFRALESVFAEEGTRADPLWLGSVKTNIGHAEAAAGIAGLIKVVLAMRRQWLPAHLHFETANPYIDLKSVPARIPVIGQPWRRTDRPLRAGVNSFGISGTNAHVVVEQAPEAEATPPSMPERSMHVLPLSAKSVPALRALVRKYQTWIDAHPEADLGNLCHTAGVGRAHHDHRLAIVANSRERFLRLLGAASELTTSSRVESARRVAFLFTGQGSQYTGMARELSLREPAFRRAMRDCCTILRGELERPLEDILYSNSASASELDDTANTQPALFAVEYALARMLDSWGVRPAAVMGHSVGEYAAACIAGVFSLEDGLKLIAARGRLMSALPRDGAMLAVLGRSDLVTRALAREYADISVGAYNGPDNTVVAGRRETIDRLEQELTPAGVKSVLLQVSHAFHSPLMEPMLQPFAEIAHRIRFHAPTLEVISNVSGERAGSEIATADYWVRHVRQPVRFEQGIKALVHGGARLMVEIGPHPVLSGMGRKIVGDANEVKWLHTLERGLADWDSLARAVGALYEKGLDIAWSEVDAAFPRRRSNLPTYPWQRQRFWFAPAGRSAPRSRATQFAAELLFDLEWQPRSDLSQDLGHSKPDFLPSLVDLRHELHQGSLLRLAAANGATASAVAKFDELAVKFVVHALRTLGWSHTVGEHVVAETLAKELGILANHVRLFVRMLDILAEARLLESENTGWRVVRSLPTDDPTALAQDIMSQLPHHAVELRLFERCASRLAEVLTGRCDPLQLLFANDSANNLGQLYDDSAMSREPNALIRQLITSVAAAVPPNRVLRVLEIGAGTGGTTGHLLPLLQSVPNEYVFTDVSKLFLTRAADKYRDYCGIQFALLDIEQSPAIQGFASGQFDLILAANVLHATRDMQTTLEQVRTMLAPGGMLALIEGIRPARWIDLLFGQTDGWWRFTDLGLRPSHPLLSLDAWHGVLRTSGFVEVATVPTQGPDRPNVFEQALVMARTSTTANAGYTPAHGALARTASTWLIFGDASRLCTELTVRLESLGHHVIRMPSVARDLASALASVSLPCRYAVCLSDTSSDLSPGMTADYERTIACFTHALDAAQALILSTSAALPRLWFITRGTQPAGGATPDPGAATVWGLGRVLAKEHPEVYGGLIDLERDVNVSADVTAIIAHIVESSGADQCAIRSGVRYIPQLIPTRATAETELNWPDDGCYIVTGGLSGVGLHLARWMAQQGARRLVLMSRRSLPPRAEWKAMAAGDSTYETIAGILDIEQLGAAVKTVAADIADEAAVSETIKLLGVESWLPIHGVVHGATASDDGLIANLDSNDLRHSFHAKVLGTLTLESALANQPLKFFVYCSSLTSLLPEEGQTNYAAANAFLDAHAARRRSQGHTALCVNWGSWYGAGAAATKDGQRTVRSLEQRGFMAFKPQAGVAALELLLRRHAAQAVVTKMDWAAFQEAYPAGTVPPMLERLAARASALNVAPVPTVNETPTAPPLGDRIRALDPGRPRAAAVEDYLRKTLADVLGLDAAAIDSTVTLGSLGLDSLMGVEFRNRCERSLGVRLSATMVWNYPTLADLTRHVSEKLPLPSASSQESRTPPEFAASASADASAAHVFDDVRDLSEEEALKALLAGSQ